MIKRAVFLVTKTSTGPAIVSDKMRSIDKLWTPDGPPPTEYALSNHDLFGIFAVAVQPQMFCLPVVNQKE